MAVDRRFLKRLAELVDGDSWVIADLLVEEFPADDFGDAESGGGGNTGIHAELEIYETALSKEYGVEFKASTMRRFRTTAIKWPSGARAPLVSFDAHSALRGDDRFELMRVYLRKAKHEGKHALSRRMVQRYRSEDTPAKPAPPWEAQVARAVNSLAKRLVLGNVISDRDDWWNARNATPNRRRTVATALREMADRLE